MPDQPLSRLSESERRQLRTLKIVHDNPTITGQWKGAECDRLVELGLAQRVDYHGVGVVSITPAGLEEAGRLAF